MGLIERLDQSLDMSLHLYWRSVLYEDHRVPFMANIRQEFCAGLFRVIRIVEYLRQTVAGLCLQSKKPIPCGILADTYNSKPLGRGRIQNSWVTYNVDFWSIELESAKQ